VKGGHVGTGEERLLDPRDPPFTESFRERRAWGPAGQKGVDGRCSPVLSQAQFARAFTGPG